MLRVSVQEFHDGLADLGHGLVCLLETRQAGGLDEQRKQRALIAHHPVDQASERNRTGIMFIPHRAVDQR